MMYQTQRYPAVISLYLLLAFFAILHLINDFLFGVPAELGLSAHLTQFMAEILKHIPLMILSGPYWSGWFSELLIIGLILAGLFCSLASGWVLLKKRSSNEIEN